MVFLWPLRPPIAGAVKRRLIQSIFERSLVFEVNAQNEFQLRLFQSVELRERAGNISGTVVVESIQFADKITMMMFAGCSVSSCRISSA